MITTYRQLVENTIAKYEGATSLSVRDYSGWENGVWLSRCTYAAVTPGSVGCAIGCNLPAEDALALDASEVTNVKTIDKLLSYEETKVIIQRSIDTANFDDGVLLRLQAAHDRAESVRDFREWLQRELTYINDGIIDAASGKFLTMQALLSGILDA